MITKTLYLVIAATFILGSAGCVKENAPAPTLATIATSSVTSITPTTAQCGGTISNEGGNIVTARGVCWSSSPNPTIATNHTTDSAGTGVFISNITGLSTGTIYYVRAYATNSYGTAYGLQVSFSTTGVTDIDLNVYNTVTIGTQVWMKENLKTTRYRNGDYIEQVQDSLPWLDLPNTSPPTAAYCFYNGDMANSDTYGALYNGYAATDPRGVCPTGWHVPSDAEFTQLTDYLGGEAIAGGKMKSITLWSSPGDNTSGFSALPAGIREVDAGFYSMGDIAYFWSNAVEFNGGAFESQWYRRLWGNSVDRSDHFREFGCSIRCIKD